MTMKIYRRSPGESGPPTSDSSVVNVTVDPEQALGDEFREAVTGAWPPCRCPRHRKANTLVSSG
ncbi:hypothetical protein ACMA1D_06945 [Streptomyces sp. 796.1]|uniref:hypothetical protein n=1 Tax=Streptomyces sp. 796.1 TaxID=3163029 RepID=UPI0039C94C30